MRSFFNWKNLLKCCNYPKNSTFFHETNKRSIGKIKDVFSGIIIEQFVGLKLEMHSMKKIDVKYCNTAKGVSIAIEFNKLSFCFI